MPFALKPLSEVGAPFLEYVDTWLEKLEPAPLERLLAEAGGPDHVAIFSVDMINGFCHEGRLQSDRVKAIIEPVVELFTHAHAQGVTKFVLTQDCHPLDAVEFEDFPVHCVVGTVEANTVPELAELPFAHLFKVMPKRTISSAIGTELDAWLRAHPEVTHRIVVGDCTDLCTYQLAMHLKLTANAANIPAPVIVPANCVDTYDLPLDIAQQVGVLAHPGGLFHSLFLYHLALNGVRVIDSLA